MAGGSRPAPAVGPAPPPQRGARGVRGRFALVLLVAVHLLDVVARAVEERIIVLVGLASFGPIVVVGIGRGIEEVARYGGPHGLSPFIPTLDQGGDLAPGLLQLIELLAMLLVHGLGNLARCSSCRSTSRRAPDPDDGRPWTPRKASASTRTYSRKACLPPFRRARAAI